jgi:hypothetical protein
MVLRWGVLDYTKSSAPQSQTILIYHSKDQVSSNPGLKRAIMGAFFDIKKIDNICHEYGMEFSNR